jgi:hypothetical protein
MKWKDATVCFILLEMIELEAVVMYLKIHLEWRKHGNCGQNISSM